MVRGPEAIQGALLTSGQWIHGTAGREGPWALPWSRESTSGLLCPAFSCPFPGAPCPAAQRRKDPTKAPPPLKGQSQAEGHGWRGDPGPAGGGAPESHGECREQHKGLPLEDWREKDGLLAAGWGPTSAREFLPVQPPARSRAPGHPGGSGAAARSSGGDACMAPKPGRCKLLGIVWGREGGGEGGGNLAGGQAAVSTCLLPAPLPQNRFGQSGVQEGGWNNGSPMPRRGSEGPQTDTLKMGRRCFSSQETGHPLF